MSEQESNDPKFYKGGKSKALRALKAIGEHAEAAADKLLFQHGETAEWGFYPLDAKAAQEAGERAAKEDKDAKPQTECEMMELGEPGTGTVSDATGVGSAPDDVVMDSVPGSDLETGSDDAAGANVFGNAAAQLANVPSAAPAPQQRAASRTTYTIEKNRPEQNGIKRPSAGGLCRAVWDACDDFRTQNGGRMPESKDVRAMAETRGWNKNNAMIEFYNWRRYNGVTGRSAKAEAQAAAPASAPAAETQQAA